MEPLIDDLASTRDRRAIASRAAASEVCDLASSLSVADELTAITAMEQAALIGGADAALFVWMVPEAEGNSSYRSIAAIDHEWGGRTLRRLHAGSHNWLEHAARSNEPLLAHELASETEADSTLRADHPRVVYVIPAPTPPKSDVLSVLVLASRNEEELNATRSLLPVYRVLALSLSDYFQRHARDTLVRQAHLSDRDLDLLRRESSGHGSKRIASALHVEPKTIDCRFHRLIVRLGVANRRDAVRLCRRYGLI